MSTISIEEAQARLPDVIEKLHDGEELIITREDVPIARLVRAASPEQPPRKFGTLKGTVLYMAPDFDAPLDDFKEYME